MKFFHTEKFRSTSNCDSMSGTMRYRFIMLLVGGLFLLPIVVLASDKQPNCESPERGEDLIACAAIRHKAADAEMNVVYKELIAVLRRRGDLETEARLRQAQRAWLGFQNAHCELESTYEGAGGSYVSANWGRCMAGTVAERTKYLQTLLAYFR